MESTEFVADFVTTAGAVNVDCFVLMSLRITFSGERLTVSGDCLPMLTKMAPRNVMPSLFIVCTSEEGILSFLNPQFVFHSFFLVSSLS